MFVSSRPFAPSQMGDVVALELLPQGAAAGAAAAAPLAVTDPRSISTARVHAGLWVLLSVAQIVSTVGSAMGLVRLINGEDDGERDDASQLLLWMAYFLAVVHSVYDTAANARALAFEPDPTQQAGATASLFKFLGASLLNAQAVEILGNPSFALALTAGDLVTRSDTSWVDVGSQLMYPIASVLASGTRLALEMQGPAGERGRTTVEQIVVAEPIEDLAVQVAGAAAQNQGARHLDIPEPDVEGLVLADLDGASVAGTPEAQVDDHSPVSAFPF